MRKKPRWSVPSVVKYAAPTKFEMLLSIAALPFLSAKVAVGPPLFASASAMLAVATFVWSAGV